MEVSADGTRVLKFTKGDNFGHTPAGYQAPFADALDTRPAAAGEYLDRAKLLNEHFGTDYKVEGVAKTGEHAGLVISQTRFIGDPPTKPEISAHMKAAGFVQLKPDNIANNYMDDKSWYHPQKNLVVMDTKPANFIKTSDGSLHPIDLMIAKPAPGSLLHRAVMQNLKLKNRVLNSAPADGSGINVKEMVNSPDNDSPDLVSTAAALAREIADSLEPVRVQLEKIRKLDDADAQQAALKKLQANFPALAEVVRGHFKGAEILTPALLQSFVAGFNKPPTSNEPHT